MAYFSFAAQAIYDIENLEFSATDYSKFKFGESQIAAEYGKILAKKFIEKHHDLLLEHAEIVIISSPFNAIPTASFAMTYFFKKEINSFLFEHGKQAAMDSKIHRYKTYSTDYGNLDFEARKKLISTDKYHLDKSFLEHRLCLFLDDVKITGSHEYVIRQQIELHGLHDKGTFGFVYFAELKNANVAPQFENVLNYAHVKGIKEIVVLMQSPTFWFNTRVVKFILISQKADIEYFIKNVTKEKIESLVHWAIANNYHQMAEYQENLDLMRSII
jgi:hypothetical protein